MILKVHRSNFNITGFTEEASLSSLVGLGRELGLPVVHDLGSGLLIDPGSLGLPPEPTPKESLSQGTDIVIFSGDKLLGGPQAGILVGSGEEWITGMRKDPLCRALRVDKMTLAALEATLSLYRDPKVAMAEVPILRMLSASVGELTERASMLVAALSGASINVEVIDCCSVMGGGTFPGFELPSIGLSVEILGCSPDRLATKLRNLEVPTVGRVEKDLLLIVLRTISQGQDQQLIENLSSLCS
jgi:L-seryl-tRNA(Ser) seleniumtransferase